jgi:hypothetical protein
MVNLDHPKKQAINLYVRYDTLRSLREREGTILPYIHSGKGGIWKGLAQCKGDFNLDYILRYIEKVVSFHSVRMRTVKKGIRILIFITNFYTTYNWLFEWTAQT